MYFDRSGAVESVPLDIHAGAMQLVQIIRMLGDNDLSGLGFDPSIYWSNGHRFVDVARTTSGSRKPAPLQYQIESVLFQRPRMVERGTTCWVVKDFGSGESLLMKDAWQDEDQGEEDFLTLANEKAIAGVGKLLFVDNTRTSDISSLRGEECIATANHRNRVFRRLFLELQGPSIRHFDSGVHLLQALRDVADGIPFLQPSCIHLSDHHLRSTSPARQSRHSSPRYQS